MLAARVNIKALPARPLDIPTDVVVGLLHRLDAEGLQPLYDELSAKYSLFREA